MHQQFCRNLQPIIPRSRNFTIPAPTLFLLNFRVTNDHVIYAAWDSSIKYSNNIKCDIFINLCYLHLSEVHVLQINLSDFCDYLKHLCKTISFCVFLSTVSNFFV